MRAVKHFCLISSSIFLVLTSFHQAEAQSRRRTTTSTPSAKWIGQTDKDFVGKSLEPAPDQIQDIQVRVSGMFPERLTSILLKGKGGGQWEWLKDENPKIGWAIHVEPGPSPGYADLFFESDQLETGREFELKWTSQGQPEQTIYFGGGKSDPTKPVATANFNALWIGQNVDKPVDLTNRSAAVGPDGFEDVVIELSNLSDRDEIKAIDIATASGKNRWSFGTNPEGVWSAEIIRQPAKAKTAKLVLSVPTSLDGNLSGQKLSIRLTYENGAMSETAIEAGKAASDMAMPEPKLPKLISTSAKVNWVGTVTKSKMGAGSVRLEITGLLNQSQLNAVVLTEPSGSVFAASEGPNVIQNARPLLVDKISPEKIRLDFQPTRDLNNVPVSVRLLFADQSTQILSTIGGKTDLEAIIPNLPSGNFKAKPGDDLQSLVNRHGTVTLTSGEYRLNRPLTIDKPTRIEVEPNSRVIVKFTAGAGEDWTSAIKIRSGGVSLAGFTITCDSTIRWNQSVSYGPAVIATTDPMDNGFNHDTPLWGVNLQKLTIFGPTPVSATESRNPPEAMKLIRIMNVSLGKIEGCILRGGTVHLSGGPWTFRQNRHDGPPAGSFAYDALAVMRPVDLLVEANRIEPLLNSGKLWRFLTLTQNGTGVNVRGNLVRNTGPKTGDTIENMNANEILLTESYKIRFEGEPAMISPEGTIVILPENAMSEAAQPGDCLAILSGPNAGKFHVVTQSLGNGAVVVDPPMDSKDRSINPPSVSLTHAFKSVIIDRNTIDATGSSSAFNLVLAGNHFGTKVTGNTLIGGGESLRLTAFPTESPNIWGWSHVPMFGLVITGNSIEGAAKPGRLAVDQGEKIKSSRGRVYYSAEFSGNSLDRSDEGPALQIGDAGTLDEASLIINLSDNQAKSSDPQISVVAGRVNGQNLKNTKIPISTSNTLRTSDRRGLKR